MSSIRIFDWNCQHNEYKKNSNIEVCRLAIVGILFIFFIPGPIAFAHKQWGDRPEEKLLARIEHVLEEGDAATALTLLDTFDQQFAEKARRGDLFDAAHLRYEALGVHISKSDQQSALSWIEPLKKEYTTLYQFSLEDRTHAEAEGKTGQVLYELAKCQSLTLDCARKLIKVNLHKEAIELLSKSKDDYLHSQVALEEEAEIKIRAPEGGKTLTIKSKPWWKILRMRHPEGIQHEIIRTAQKMYNTSANEENKKLLISAFDTYVNEFTEYPHAGVYMSMEMELADNFDLDKLVDVYRKCRDKNHSQYIYSSLGLAHYLRDAGRTKEALSYLEHINQRGIDVARQPELFYALGKAYFSEGNESEAIKYFLAVSAMTDRYDTKHFLNQIIGNPDKVANETLRNLITSEDFKSLDVESTTKESKTGNTITKIVSPEAPSKPVKVSPPSNTNHAKSISLSSQNIWIIIIFVLVMAIAVIFLLRKRIKI